MLDYLIEDNNLEKDFEKYGLKLPQDLIFIKEMINGPETEDLVVDSVAQKEDNDVRFVSCMNLNESKLSNVALFIKVQFFKKFVLFCLEMTSKLLKILNFIVTTIFF